ncbi:MAG: 3-oxo-tetronate 4-phosphate decarboxylase [Woeseiaceae bacterium]|nr:3-oxo-tetronate 4-phosphate decarboxylase [Woeseiaceae bacterium]
MNALTESVARERIVLHGESLHLRGYVPGSSGNISTRIADGILVSPTDSCLGRLDPARIAKLDLNGKHVSGDPPSKEAFLHALFYSSRKTAEAVVHLHCTHAVAISCRSDLDVHRPIAPLTPYFVMKVGRLKVLPYFPPGEEALAHAVEAVATRHHAILLANHGPVVAGTSIDSAVYAIEELEEAAKLQLMLEGRAVRGLTADEVSDLEQRFPS